MDLPARLAAVEGEVRERLAGLRHRIGAELQPELDRLLARHRLLDAGSARLLHPLAQPLLELPLWWVDFAAARGLAVDAGDLGEATVTGYLHVRVEDDWVDEGVGDRVLAPLLSDAFLVRHLVLLGRLAGGDARFWAYVEEVGLAYGDAMALEHRLHDAGARLGAPEFDAILRRSHPLVLPGAAVLAATDAWPLLARAEQLVHHLVRAGQLVGDVVDCRKDLAAGNHTWVVRRLGGLQGPDAMVGNLVAGGAEVVFDEALADLDRAAAAAAVLPLPGALAWLARRRQAVAEMRASLASVLAGPPRQGDDDVTDRDPIGS